MPGSNKCYLQKTSPRLWVLLSPPEPKELALMSDSEGWWLERAESRVWGLKGDRRQGSPHQAEERSVHLHPASGMDKKQTQVWQEFRGLSAKAAGFLRGPGFLSIWFPLLHPSVYPAVFAASSFPGFKTALPKLMLRREVTTKVNLLIELFSNTEERVLIGAGGGFCWSCQRNPLYLCLLFWTWAYIKYLLFNKY